MHLVRVDMCIQKKHIYSIYIDIISLYGIYIGVCDICADCATGARAAFEKLKWRHTDFP